MRVAQYFFEGNIRAWAKFPLLVSVKPSKKFLLDLLLAPFISHGLHPPLTQDVNLPIFVRPGFRLRRK